MSSIITNNTQPKYGPRVQAEYVYKHLYEGVPVETIVEKQFPLTIGRATIYRWISHYQDFGEVPFITYEKEKQLRKRIGSVTNTSINNVVYNTLINIDWKNHLCIWIKLQLNYLIEQGIRLLYLIFLSY